MLALVPSWSKGALSVTLALASVTHGSSSYSTWIVSKALTALSSSRAATAAIASPQNRALSNARRAAELATERYRAGIVSYLEVVDANRAALQTERGTAQLSGQRLATMILLAGMRVQGAAAGLSAAVTLCLDWPRGPCRCD